MMAGCHKAEEIARAAAAVKQAQAATTMRQKLLSAPAHCAPAAPFPPTIWRTARHISSGRYRQIKPRRRAGTAREPPGAVKQRRRRWPRPNWTCTIPCSPPLLDGTLMTRVSRARHYAQRRRYRIDLSLTHPGSAPMLTRKTSARCSRDKKCCSIPTAGRISPITGQKSALFLPSAEFIAEDRDTGSGVHRSGWSTVCALW